MRFGQTADNAQAAVGGAGSTCYWAISRKHGALRGVGKRYIDGRPMMRNARLGRFLLILMGSNWNGGAQRMGCCVGGPALLS
jgi:hypothetical protein